MLAKCASFFLHSDFNTLNFARRIKLINFAQKNPEMKNRDECIKAINAFAPFIQTEYGVKTMVLFGSFAKNEATAESDIDLLVEMPPKAFKFVELREYLQKNLGRPVDLIRKRNHLDPFLMSEINRYGVSII